ncbi:MAG TPA: sigma 54-interacting transcriptional regulator [Methylomirabilota bacterium]|jgi:transcriptional regulator with PAS, ATPase and Fis domain/tetratricopeptide (TPR) repeat protein|nr:sigma 54-interacting transcriptional regulator [Methylomirabilota bacterium]
MPVLGQVLGESAPIAAVRDQVTRLLRSASGPGRRLPPILVLGETGTGKGLLASAIHAGSVRAGGPFVDVNCAAIPETLIEAELFGFERGAFTDARHAKPGLFQAASGGTIFLDEVGLLPASMQSKLLKVIEEREVRRLGSTRSEPVDAAILAATSEDLAVAVRDGRFRPDLYHRLAVVTLQLPPLRARGRDIVVLAEEFLVRVCEDYGLPTRELTEDARAALLAYPWPGNVRELTNVLERAALLADGPQLTAASLGLPAQAPVESERAVGGDDDAERERRQVLDALEATDWNFTRAAARLGLPRNTLRYRVERLGLSAEGHAERRRGGRPPAVRAAAPAESPAPAVRETRRVTLMQAHIVGEVPASWELARGLEEGIGKIRSFGGQVEEITDDTMLAIFGLEPDEDAPRRATYAALALRTLAARAAGETAGAPQLTVALHTDFLPVVREGAVVQIDASATEDARHALQQVLDVAPAGAVVATAAASPFLARRFELAPLGSRELRASRVVSTAEPGHTRFVGRERELRLLRECFELTRAGQGQTVMIVGEPGIGKSRLLQELRRQLGRGATWVEGQALSFGRSMPFHPVIDMIRRVCRIDDADSEAMMYEKLERAARRLGDEVAEAIPYVRYLLSLDPGDPAVRAMDPRERHAAIVHATQRLVARGSELRPHVFVLEDLHWCDAATEDWITRLAETIGNQCTMIVMTYRPGYRSGLARRGFQTALSLSTLSSEESLRVASGLLDVEEMPPALQSLVLTKAEGNPFFIEELVRSLQEQGAISREGDRLVLTASLDQVAVPATVEDILLDRTHRLDEALSRVLEVAAVIGSRIPFGLLRAVTGRTERELTEDLRRLQVAEFLREARVFPEIEFRFKHALTHDVAYRRVPAERREALHARIFDSIETLHRERLDDHVERLAYHAARGGRWTEAVRYARRAGIKAFERSANREAVTSFDEALASLAHLPETAETLAEAIDIRLAARSALLQLAELPRIEHSLREAETLATALGDRRRLAWIWTFRSIAHLFAGEISEAHAVGEQALATAEEIGDLGLRASARTPLGHACCERGDYRRAVTLYSEAIDALSGPLLRERLGQAVPPSLYARSIAAICLAELGEFSEAERFATEAATLTRTLDLPFGFVLARMALGHAAIVQGRADEAIRSLEPAMQTIEARGIPTWQPWVSALHGYALALGGRPADGRAVLESALERAVKLPFLFGHSQWMAWLAHAYLLEGRIDEARKTGDEALRLSRQRGTRGYEALSLWVLGEVEARRGATLTAETLARQGLVLAETLGMRPLADRCRATLDRLRHDGGADQPRTATA